MLSVIRTLQNVLTLRGLFCLLIIPSVLHLLFGNFKEKCNNNNNNNNNNNGYFLLSLIMLKLEPT